MKTIVLGNGANKKICVKKLETILHQTMTPASRQFIDIEILSKSIIKMEKKANELLAELSDQNIEKLLKILKWIVS